MTVVAGPPVGLETGYVEVRELGRGSFGVAKLVSDAAGAQFAMKLVALGPLSARQRRDAENEAVLLASLRHPYMVHYVTSFVDSDRLAIVMEFAEGGDLQTRIFLRRKAKAPFAEAVVLRWLTQTALGVKYLHGRRILHRDLKSQNLLLTRAGDVRIADFGTAVELDRSSDTIVEDVALGSPSYLSPEIYLKTQYSFRSDIWALGCVLFELAALRMPFVARNVAALMFVITQDRRPPALPEVFSADLRKLNAEMLSYDPDRRPGAADVVKLSFVRVEMQRLLKESMAQPHRRAQAEEGPLQAHQQQTHERDREEMQQQLKQLHQHQQQRQFGRQQRRGSVTPQFERSHCDDDFLEQPLAWKRFSSADDADHEKEIAGAAGILVATGVLPLRAGLPRLRARLAARHHVGASSGARRSVAAAEASMALLSGAQLLLPHAQVAEGSKSPSQHPCRLPLCHSSSLLGSAASTGTFGASLSGSWSSSPQSDALSSLVWPLRRQ